MAITPCLSALPSKRLNFQNKWAKLTRPRLKFPMRTQRLWLIFATLLHKTELASRLDAALIGRALWPPEVPRKVTGKTS